MLCALRVGARFVGEHSIADEPERSPPANISEPLALKERSSECTRYRFGVRRCEDVRGIPRCCAAFEIRSWTSGTLQALQYYFILLLAPSE